MSTCFQRNWRLYIFEGAELAAFMISACVFTVILYHPAYAAVRSIPNPAMRRILMGVAMGVTAVLIIHSPMGKRSGAHFNPAITLTYFRLHKVDKRDAAFYVVFQFIGGAAGVGFAAILLGSSIAVPEVNYAVTVPGPQGTTAAFFAELFMATLLMAVVLWSSNTPALAKYTSYFVGVLIALYILVFAPVSGFSINPARTFGSAVFANLWTAWWIYFIAPPLGMLGVAQIYVLTYGHEEIPGAKPFHQHSAAVGQKEKRAAS